MKLHSALIPLQIRVWTLVLLTLVNIVQVDAQTRTFTNPLMASGADPWVVHRDGWYYFTSTQGNRVDIRKSRTLAGLADAVPVTVWKAPPAGLNSRDIWAPEFHWVSNRWYIYFTGTTEDRSDANRRIFVLESVTDDLQGKFVEKGKLTPPDEDEYAIDGTLFQNHDGKFYFLWSGRAESKAGSQNIYIAQMSNPWTICSSRVQISTPEYEWEKHGWAVNEGPEVLQRNGNTFVIFSGSGFTMPNYCLGLLVNTNGNLMDPASWKKLPEPVFSACEEGKVFGPGHNGFFKSPDSKEDWIIYHARDTAAKTPHGRSARAQRFSWKADGTPDFGKPVKPGTPVPVPSGEQVAEK